MGLRADEIDETVNYLSPVCLPREKTLTSPRGKVVVDVMLYRVCHGFRLTKRDDYFQVNFDHF